MPRAREATLPLRSLQGWFQEHTMRPSALPRRAGAVKGPAVDAVILPSQALTARERLEIYADSYFVRLHECLRGDYPVVLHLLGAERFERLARAYVTRHPSRHYSLNLLGAKLPAFIASGELRVPRQALVADVARLELAMAEVFDAAPSPALDQAALQAIPPDAWSRVRLRVAHAFRLVAFDHPVNAIVSAVRQEKPLPPLRRARTRVVVYRKDFQVWRMDLSEPMYAALAALAKGRPIPAAVRAAAGMFEGSREALEAQVFRWFADWRQEGLFQAVEVPPRRARRGR